jgi:hypothetical protein
MNNKNRTLYKVKKVKSAVMIVSSRLLDGATSIQEIFFGFYFLVANE